MARQRAQVKVNQFVGGFITEANPLSFPQNSNLDEENFDILEDGSRQRRLGFNLEDSYSELDTGIYKQEGYRIGVSQFRWSNVGGNPDKKILVVQVGNYIGFHDLDTLPLSGNLIHSETMNANTYNHTYSYASVDGILVVATGEKVFYTFEYDNGTITRTDKILYTRDLFGVEATVDGKEVTNVDNINYRPFNLNNEHLYNLRNQTWALPRVEGDDNTINMVDCIEEFYEASKEYMGVSFPDWIDNPIDPVYPSNADSVTAYLFADANLSANRTVERFNGETSFKTKPEINVAPKGYFVIDALERGQSRLNKESELRANNPELVYSVNDLPEDRTPDGASVVESYAGRVWYAGFSGKVINGDNRSPKMSSYVMFSQIVNEPTQINKCYQEASPTSNVDANLVDTDGGFLKLEGAYNIKKMVNVQSSLFVFAENGVWEITGVDRNTFTATQYRVNKVSDEGCVSSGSVVLANNILVYWANSSINLISRNDFGDWVVQDLTENTIRTFYSEISLKEKKQCVGYYDPSLSSIRWLYGIDLEDTDSYGKELILNFKYQSFLKSSINTSDNVIGPVSISGGPLINTTINSNVTVEGVIVQNNLEDVYVSILEEAVANPNKYFYCILVDDSSTLTYTFGGYNNSSWLDWGETDASAFILTAPNTIDEARLRKDIPYLTLYFSHTGEEDSSCLLSTRWNWTSGSGSGRWTTPRQAYRPRDIYQDVETIVATRNKIRGGGRAFSFKLETEEGNDLRVYGWDHNIAATTEE